MLGIICYFLLFWCMVIHIHLYYNEYETKTNTKNYFTKGNITEPHHLHQSGKDKQSFLIKMHKGPVNDSKNAHICTQ